MGETSKRTPEADLARFILAAVAILAALCLLTLVLVGCGPSKGEADVGQLIIAIDRTGVAQSDTWSNEVAVQTQAAVEQAFADDVDHVALLSIGSNTDQTATVADVDLTDIEGNTEAKREAARQALIQDVASVAAQVASQPVETHGTDVVAGFQQAASVCDEPEVTKCSVLVLSDLEDQRVVAAPTAEAGVAELGDLMPDLVGVSIQVSGLGASGADAATVQKVRAVWTELLSQAGAIDVRIARSL